MKVRYLKNMDNKMKLSKLEWDACETLLNRTKLETKIRESEMEKYVLILGVMHSNNNEYNCYEWLIEKIRPSSILYEACYNCCTKPIYHDLEFNRWIENHNFKSISCDLTDEEKDRIKNEISCNYKIIRYETQISDRLYYNEREKRMGENILKYKETDKPIIVIIGHDHAGEWSNIHNILKGKTEYITFWKNNKCCKECGIRLDKDDKHENCSSCGADLYNLIIHKRNINHPSVKNQFDML